jgi:indolepyruvate ferredoxin oxidoreductase alpha subunit
MSKKLLMGNEAIALGAIRANVRLAAGYPGTPSTEIIETIAANNPEKKIHVEWSINEKAAVEVACGAAYSGARALVTMKQVGLNVAADPVMSLSYVGVKGGMVIVVADDPGPISSQTEQDTRVFGQFSKIPVFDPVSPEDAYLMIADCFEYSEKYKTPVILRPTTRVCHGCASVTEMEPLRVLQPEGFIKDSLRWVIFPRLSYNNHLKIEDRNEELAEVFSNLPYNKIENDVKSNNKIGIAAGGDSYLYVKEIAEDDIPIMRIGTPYPFPEPLALKFLNNKKDVIVFEELSPVIEEALLKIAGKYHLDVNIHGKITRETSRAGENSTEIIKEQLEKFVKTYGADSKLAVNSRSSDNCLLDHIIKNSDENTPSLPIRPPVLCAGCPHRASFYAVKTAVKVASKSSENKDKKYIFCGDIGCYTLGNAKPLDMVDTCLCMGADVTIAQGFSSVDEDTIAFSFIGDSTFFASGMTGVVNAIYNAHDIILVVLDNATTAMTGKQPHPGTGATLMGTDSGKADIAAILKAMGVENVKKINPFEFNSAVKAVAGLINEKGVRAIIFESPCVAGIKPAGCYTIKPEMCKACMKCIKEIGCPAIIKTDGKAFIESSLCTGCGLCVNLCKFGAIWGV